MSHRTIQAVIDPTAALDLKKRYWKLALFNEDGSPFAGDRLAHAENTDANGVSGITTRTRLRAMVIDVVAPPSGVIRVTGKVAYATASATGAMAGLSLRNEADTIQYDGGYGNRPTTASGVSNVPSLDATIEGLIPGNTYSFGMFGEGLSGSAAFATPFTLDAWAVIL